jgi:hypothetical protein
MTNDKSIDERIVEKRDELLKIHASLAIYLLQQVSSSTQGKVQELQDRLEYRVKEYEEKLLDEKIVVYNKVLKLLKP